MNVDPARDSSTVDHRDPPDLLEPTKRSTSAWSALPAAAATLLAAGTAFVPGLSPLKAALLTGLGTTAVNAAADFYGNEQRLEYIDAKGITERKLERERAQAQSVLQKQHLAEQRAQNVDALTRHETLLRTAASEERITKGLEIAERDRVRQFEQDLANRIFKEEEVARNYQRQKDLRQEQIVKDMIRVEEVKAQQLAFMRASQAKLAENENKAGKYRGTDNTQYRHDQLKQAYQQKLEKKRPNAGAKSVSSVPIKSYIKGSKTPAAYGVYARSVNPQELFPTEQVYNAQLGYALSGAGRQPVPHGAILPRHVPSRSINFVTV